jgi:hypothetical protein
MTQKVETELSRSNFYRMGSSKHAGKALSDFAASERSFVAATILSS